MKYEFLSFLHCRHKEAIRTALNWGGGAKAVQYKLRNLVCATLEQPYISINISFTSKRPKIRRRREGKRRGGKFKNLYTYVCAVMAMVIRLEIRVRLSWVENRTDLSRKGCLRLSLSLSLTQYFIFFCCCLFVENAQFPHVNIDPKVGVEVEVETGNVHHSSGPGGAFP